MNRINGKIKFKLKFKFIGVQFFNLHRYGSIHNPAGFLNRINCPFAKKFCIIRSQSKLFQLKSSLHHIRGGGTHLKSIAPRRLIYKKTDAR